MNLLLVLALICSPPTVDIPAEVRPAGQYVVLSPKTDAKAITYIGLSDVEPIPAAVLKDPRTFLLDTRGLAVGRYRFIAVASLDDEHSRTEFAVVVGTPGPVVVNPPVVNPPGPPVNPPLPSPGTPLTGMRVLILEETSPLQAMPRPIREALQSPQVREYLDQKASDNGKRRWRKLDPSVSLANLPAEWHSLRNQAAKDMAARGAHPDQPWVVVAGLVGAGEQVFFSGPYPGTPDEAIAFFRKWGG